TALPRSTVSSCQTTKRVCVTTAQRGVGGLRRVDCPARIRHIDACRNAKEEQMKRLARVLCLSASAALAEKVRKSLATTAAILEATGIKVEQPGPFRARRPGS